MYLDVDNISADYDSLKLTLKDNFPKWVKLSFFKNIKIIVKFI